MAIEPTEGPSLRQHYAFVQWAVQFPALTVSLWLRRDIGYRLIHPAKLFAVAGIVFVVAILATPGNEDARPADLAVFAVLTFAIGMYQRIKRWSELNRGIQQYSYYTGTSAFSSFRWLPHFVRRNRRPERFLDPFVCALIGLAFLPVSRALGMWLVFSAFCLRSFQHQVFMRQRNLDLDMIDSIVISELQSQVLDQYEQEYGAPQHQTDNAVPTGMSEDVQTSIGQRHARAADKRK
jgi:hypothetical protein